MLKYEFINREWIVSRTARLVYRVSALLSLMLFFLWLMLLFAWLGVFNGVQTPEHAAPVVRLLLFAGILGAAITIVGMEFFLFRFDTSHPLKQVFWFCVMLIPLLGAALYCFVVYSRSDALKNSLTVAGEKSPFHK